jgi:hypothetical protein
MVRDLVNRLDPEVVQLLLKGTANVFGQNRGRRGHGMFSLAECLLDLTVEIRCPKTARTGRGVKSPCRHPQRFASRIWMG